MVRFFVFLALFLIAGCLASGATVGVDFDAAQTKINWVLIGNVHTTHGTFALKRGHISLDTETGVMSGELLVEANSGDSGNQTRDKRMNNEVLESERFPHIKLTPTKVEGVVNLSGTSMVHVSGNFLVHGSTHQISFPLEIRVTGGTVTGTGKFSVPYVEWGMKDPSNFLFKVEKAVEMEVAAVGRLSSAKP